MKKIFCICIIVLCLMMTSCRGNPNNISDNVSLDYNFSDEKTYKDNLEETETSDATQSKVTLTDNNSFEDVETKNESIAENKSSNVAQKPKTEDKAQKIEKEIHQPIFEQLEQKPTQPEIVLAKESDAEIIADKVIDYINDYRNQNGVCSATKLSGLTKLAKFRSGQLVTNFSHDTADIRIAATTVKYGEYIDTKLLGMDVEPYYSPHAVEAIAMSGYIGTVDAVAENFATLIKNSSLHWSYIGDAKNTYIGVGLTYAVGCWFMNITVSDTNQYEK